MPNKYTFRRMNGAEVVQQMRKANLSVSDVCKLTGRHFIQVKKYMEQDDEPRPTPAEMVILDYLAEYPEAAPIMLDMAEVRITGQVNMEDRLKARFGSAYVPPERRK